jgi:hypothetical protein
MLVKRFIYIRNGQDNVIIMEDYSAILEIIGGQEVVFLVLGKCNKTTLLSGF